MAAILQTPSSNYFLIRILIQFHMFIVVPLRPVSNLSTLVSIGSDNGLSMNRRQAITWTKDDHDPIQWYIYVSLSLNELKLTISFHQKSANPSLHPVVIKIIITHSQYSFHVVSRGCTQSLVVNCKYWVVPLLSNRVSGYSQVILLGIILNTPWSLFIALYFTIL